MAKPPKVGAPRPTTENPSPPRTTSDIPQVELTHNGIADTLPSVGRPQSDGAGTSTPDDTAPRVVVNSVTDPMMTELNARLADITLPESQAHLLRPLESVDGLYKTPDGRVFAPLEDGGHYRVEINADGNYQIPWPDAPGISPPVVKKIEGRSLWRVEADWYAQRRQLPATSEATTITAHAGQTTYFLEPNLASLLPAAQQSADGIRQGPHGRIYVDTANGTIMVRKNQQGEYQLASSTTRDVPVEIFEQIPGDVLWRRKLQPSSRPAGDEPQPGPAKRPRLNEDEHMTLLRPALDPDDTWRSWGSETKPQDGDSVEIDGKHYRIVAQPGHADDALVFITHPLLLAMDFEAYEGTLALTPELQPRGAIKLADKRSGQGGDKWRVVDGLPFKKPLTRYVKDSFRNFTDVSAIEIAREMFIRANHSDVITGRGMNDLLEMLTYWKTRRRGAWDQTVPGRQDLMDPFVLLSKLPRDANHYVHLPPASATGLQRIDIDTRDFFGRQYPAGRESQRESFRDVLQDHGYRVSNTFRRNAKDALLIQRRDVDAVFILFHDKFVQSSAYAHDTTQWLKRRALVTQIDPSDKKTLQEAHAANKIIYLVGGHEKLASGQTSLVIARID